MSYVFANRKVQLLLRLSEEYRDHFYRGDSFAWRDNDRSAESGRTLFRRSPKLEVDRRANLKRKKNQNNSSEQKLITYAKAFSYLLILIVSSV